MNKFLRILLILNFSVLGGACFRAEIANAQIVYTFEVVDRVEVGPLNPENDPEILTIWPSINDSGKVAYVSYEDTSVHGRIILNNNGVLEKNFPIRGEAQAGDTVQVNDADQVSFFRESLALNPNSLPLITEIIRLDTVDSGVPMGIGSLDPSITIDHFDLVTPWSSLNDQGRVVMGADEFFSRIGDADDITFLAARSDGVEDHAVSPTLPLVPDFPSFEFFTQLFPMTSNTNRTIVRMGAKPIDPVVLWLDATLRNHVTVASRRQFNALGELPGISDDGRVFGFMARDLSNVPGVYVATLNEFNLPVGFRIPFTMHPETNPNFRVGINHTGNGDPDSYRVVFFARDPGTRRLGIYSVDVYLRDPLAPLVDTPILLVEQDGTIGDFGVTVLRLDAYDPVNNNGQIVFWTRTGLSQAIIKATPEPIAPGDINGDKKVDISDAVFLLTYLFLGGRDPVSLALADTNGDGDIDVSDAVYLLLFLFAGGSPPHA